MRAAPSAAVDQPGDRAKPSPSGRLLLRMPAALHAELARSAERDGVSLNQFITGALARTVGWGDAGEGAAAARTPDSAAARRSTLIAAALVANAVVIGVTAAAAIVVLVLAWRG